MYSWKAIRSISAILLLIPILHLALLVSRETLSALDTSPEVWASEVDAYAEVDKLNDIPPEPVVIVGGRQVKLWRGLEDLLAPKSVLVRGLGDATVEDITFYYEKLIASYQPQTVVLLPSDSEFHVRDNKSAEELVAAVRKLVELDLYYRKEGRFYIFAPLLTPLHLSDRDKIASATRQLQSWADSNKQVEILDANTLLASASGSPKPDYFRIDGINLNELGYTRLSVMLLNQLERDNPDTYYPGSSPPIKEVEGSG